MLLPLVSEALIMQDRADEILALLRARAPLGQTAPAAGRLARRFFALRDRLPERCADPVEESVREELGRILDHHAFLVRTALDLAVQEYRSPRIAAQVDALTAVGAPGDRLERIYAQLRDHAAAA